MPSSGRTRKRRLEGRNWLALVLLQFVHVTGCVNWSSSRPPTPQTFATREQVRIWADNRTLRLQAVRFEGDSITGIPYQHSPTCDSCRIAIAVSQVDSIQAGKSPEALAMVLIIGLPAIGLAYIAAIASGMGD